MVINMKMCEYANNMIEMFIMFYVTKKNKIALGSGYTHATLFFVTTSYNILSFEFVFPRMYRGLHNIGIYKGVNTLWFVKSSKTDMSYQIYLY
jgi:hypothetical protein